MWFRLGGASIELCDLGDVNYHSHLGNCSYQAVGFGLCPIREPNHHSPGHGKIR